MKKELKLVGEFHEKFDVPIKKKPVIPKRDRTDLRYKLMKEEVEEYKKGTEEDDLESIAKELADILFATYGTILEHGLQDHMEEIFKEVCRSNLSKDYNQYKMVKGGKYSKADVGKILGDKK